MKHCAMLSTIVGLFIMLTATEALAHCGNCGVGGGKRMRQNDERCGCTFGPKMNEQLGLTAEQKSKVDALRDKAQKDNEPHLKKLKKLREEMRELWMADNPSEKAILKQQDKMAPRRDKMRKRRVRFKLDVFALLTPEQKTKFRDLQKLRKDCTGRGRGSQERCWGFGW